jgi:hypothetical protein
MGYSIVALHLGPFSDQALEYLLQLWSGNSTGDYNGTAGSLASPSEARDPARKQLVDQLREYTGRPDFHGDIFSLPELQALLALYAGTPGAQPAAKPAPFDRGNVGEFCDSDRRAKLMSATQAGRKILASERKAAPTARHAELLKKSPLGAQIARQRQRQA